MKAQNVKLQFLPQTFNGQRVINPKWSEHLVLLEGNAIGLITRWHQTEKNCPHPFKAFVLDGKLDPPTPNTLLGAYYPEAGGKDSAISAILANHLRG